MGIEIEAFNALFPLCKCGCGGRTSGGIYLRGHNKGALGKNLPKSKETRQKLSEALIDKTLSWRTRIRISEAQLGKKLSREHKRKISEAMTGRVFSETHRENLSKALIGRELSNEWKENLSKAHLGVPRGPHSEETKEKIGRANSGRIFTEEQRRRISEGHTGISMSEEAKRLSSQSHKALWTNLEFVRGMKKAQGMQPNWDEYALGMILEKNFPKEWMYTGDGKAGLTTGGKIPDFIHNNGRKLVIEMFGTFWHDTTLFPNRPTEAELITHYGKHGFGCLVIWDYQILENYVVTKVQGLIGGD